MAMDAAHGASTLSQKRRPVFLELRSSKLLVVTTVCIAVFTDIFMYGVIVPIIPYALPARANVAPDQVQYWTSVLIAIYGAALLISSPICGFIADATTTRRAPFLAGLVVLAGGTGCLCAGTNIALWIAGRLLQGCSAGIVWTVGLAMLVDNVGKQEVAQYLGWIGLSLSLAILAAPLLGGVVYDRGGFYAVFGMCFALIALDVFLRLFVIEHRVAARWVEARATNTNRHPSSTVDATPAQDQVEKPSSLDSPRTSRDIVESPSAADLPSNPAAVTLFRSASRIAKPRVPPIFSLLKSHRLLASLYGGTIQAVLLTSFDSTLPLRVQSLWGWSSLGAGLIFLPLAIPAFFSPVVGWACDRWGPLTRCFAASGFFFGVAPLVCLRFVEYNSLDQKILMCALLALVGWCLTSTLPPIMAEMTHVVDAEEAASPGIFGPKGAYAQAYALFNTAFALGCLIGPIWGGMIEETAGWATMTWTVGLLSGVSAIPVFLWAGGWIGSALWSKSDSGATGTVQGGLAHAV